MKLKHLSYALALALVAVGSLQAKTVDITLTAKEVSLPIDNKGTMATTWTFDGQIPGPLVRVTEGDTVNVTLINDKSNHNSHSIDMHASQEDVLTDFE
ncbi:MAG: multicopper oxidase domain-containing protein, partial [Rhodanobacter sp.]